MPLILPGNVASATASTTFSVANSCRFNDGDSAYIHKTCGSAFDTDKWTISLWCKRGALGIETRLVSCDNDDGSDDDFLKFDANDNIEFTIYGSSSYVGALKTNAVYRDPSAWYHIVAVWDSANGTAGNRMRLYVNGTEVTSFATDTNPSSGANATFGNTSHPIEVGRRGSATNQYWDGYLAEVAVCDGQAYAASDFGEFDSDSPTIWKPKDVSGLTFGTSGFYLDFEDSANLGNDANGGTDFTTSGLAAADQASDSPTNNFCTGNPLAIFVGAGPTFSEGNTVMTAPISGPPYDVSTVGTLGMSKGKFYWECKWTYGGAASNQALYLGIVATNQPMASGSTMKDNTSYNNVVYAPNGGDLRKNGADVGTDYAGSVDSIFGFALDLDNGTLKIHENGTYFNSGTAVVTSITEDTYVPLLAPNGGPTNSIISANFGGCSGFTVSSGNADADGYGNFEYAVPSGYYALCTKNIGAYGG